MEYALSRIAPNCAVPNFSGNDQKRRLALWKSIPSYTIDIENGVPKIRMETNHPEQFRVDVATASCPLRLKASSYVLNKEVVQRLASIATLVGRITCNDAEQ
jgi:hypothetical protein